MNFSLFLGNGLNVLNRYSYFFIHHSDLGQWVKLDSHMSETKQLINSQ